MHKHTHITGSLAGWIYSVLPNKELHHDMKKEPTGICLWASRHTHTHTKMKMVNDSSYAECVWIGPMKWQCVTPTVQQSIKRFDGASVWRAQEQQAEQEWKSGPDSLHIVIQLQIITRNRHNNGKLSLHKSNTYRIKWTHYGIWTCFLNTSLTNAVIE